MNLGVPGGDFYKVSVQRTYLSRDYRMHRSTNFFQNWCVGMYNVTSSFNIVQTSLVYCCLV